MNGSSTPARRTAFSSSSSRRSWTAILEALARERVFEPLGMTDTSYRWREACAGNCAIERGPIEKMFGPGFLGVANAADPS